MQDIYKHCKTCGHDHLVGELRKDRQGVPVYGARKCNKPVPTGRSWKRCRCNKFVEDEALFRKEQRERKQSSLPAVKDMTKAQVAKMFAKTGYLSPQTPLEARVAAYKLSTLPMGAKRDIEFMRAVLAVTYDTRAAFLRSDNKFAHLVAHTDEIVNAMQKVAQLAEKLESIKATQERIVAVLDGRLIEQANVFDNGARGLEDEPIVTDADPTDD